MSRSFGDTWRGLHDCTTCGPDTPATYTCLTYQIKRVCASCGAQAVRDRDDVTPSVGAGPVARSPRHPLPPKPLRDPKRNPDKGGPLVKPKRKTVPPMTRLSRILATASLPESDTEQPHNHGKPTDPRDTTLPAPVVHVTTGRQPVCEFGARHRTDVPATWLAGIGYGPDRFLCDDCYDQFGNTGRRVVT